MSDCCSEHPHLINTSASNRSNEDEEEGGEGGPSAVGSSNGPTFGKTTQSSIKPNFHTPFSV